MSADNWAICPRCEANRQASIRVVEEGVAAAYGVVSVEEFDRMRADLEARRAAEPEHTFREDYEFWGVEEGVIKASYRGGCSACGLAHAFAIEQPLDLDQKAGSR